MTHYLLCDLIICYVMLTMCILFDTITHYYINEGRHQTKLVEKYCVTELEGS